MTFKFDFEGINNQHLSLTVHSHNQQFMVTDTDPTITLDLVLPTVVHLEFSGKNYNTDTILDSDGKIIKDKYIKITSVNIDGFDLPETFLYQKLVVNTDDGRTFTTPYVGFNGAIQITLDQPDVFSQFLKLCQ